MILLPTFRTGVSAPILPHPRPRDNTPNFCLISGWLTDENWGLPYPQSLPISTEVRCRSCQLHWATCSRKRFLNSFTVWFRKLLQTNSFDTYKRPLHLFEGKNGKMAPASGQHLPHQGSEWEAESGRGLGWLLGVSALKAGTHCPYYPLCCLFSSASKSLYPTENPRWSLFSGATTLFVPLSPGCLLTPWAVAGYTWAQGKRFPAPLGY